MKDGIKSVVIVIGVLVIIISAVAYLYTVLLPVKIEGFVSNILTENTGCHVEIGAVAYIPPSQYHVRDVALYTTELSREKIAGVKNLSFSFKIWPFLKGKKIIAGLDIHDLKFRKIACSGSISLQLRDLIHPARRPFLEHTDGRIALENFSVSSEGFPGSVEKINGTIIFEGNTVKLSDGSALYGNTKYKVNGILKDLDLDEPVGSLSLISDMLASEASFILKDDYIKIKKVSGTFLNSAYSAMGDIRDITSPKLNIYCEARADLSDLKWLHPGSGNNIAETLDPDGQCILAAFFNGALDNLAEAEASIKLSSNRVSLQGLDIEDLYLDLRLRSGMLDTYRFNMRPYTGLFNGSIKVNVLEKGIPFSLSLSLKDADLKKVSYNIGTNKDRLAGLVSSKFFLKGYMNSVESLNGSGWLTVTDGQLWEIPLLGGITNLLDMPNLKSVSFEEAAGNFVISDKRIYTDDLTFYSNKVNITAKGFVDFDQNLDFLLNTNITQDLFKGSSEAVEIANLFLTQAGNYMGKIKITGTIKKPVYRIDKRPVEDLFKKEIKGLLQNILQ